MEGRGQLTQLVWGENRAIGNIGNRFVSLEAV